MPSFFNVPKPKRNLNERGRNLIDYSQVNVPRDLFNVEYFVNGAEPTDFNYNIELRDWDSKLMSLKLNFENPMQVSSGSRFDDLKLTVKETKFFVAKSGAELRLIDRIAKQKVPV